MKTIVPWGFNCIIAVFLIDLMLIVCNNSSVIVLHKACIRSTFGKYSEPMTSPSSIYTQYPIMTKEFCF
uniref:Uncharacterized protein n=1 Tax=Oncorhynchus mykiss TaxID=8022 RepID=A0A8C7RHG1_ONCMY